jgi:hypothetical protein
MAPWFMLPGLIGFQAAALTKIIDYIVPDPITPYQRHLLNSGTALIGRWQGDNVSGVVTGTD